MMNPDRSASAPTSRAPDAEGATCTLTVNGMDCGSCAQKVEKALRALEGVQDVRTDIIGERVTVRYAEGKLARGDLVGAVTRIGYQVPDGERGRSEVFEIQGMDCADEVRLIEGRLANLPGVTRLGFDLIGRRLTVEGEIRGPLTKRKR